MDFGSLTIRELLKYCLDTEDESAWNEFLRKVQPTAATTIIRALDFKAEPSMVDDLVQNTWLKLFANNREPLRRIRGDHDNSIFAYVKRTAFNVAQDHIRSLRPIDLAESIDDPDFVEPPNDQYKADFGDARIEDIERCLKELSHEPNFQRDYNIFWLHYRQGYTAKEIAQLPSITEGKKRLEEKGVEGVLYRLKMKLKECGKPTSTGA